MSGIESTVTINGTTIDTKLRFSDILDDLVTGGVVYAEGRKGRWGFQFDGVYLVTRESFGIRQAGIGFLSLAERAEDRSRAVVRVMRRMGIRIALGPG